MDLFGKTQHTNILFVLHFILDNKSVGCIFGELLIKDAILKGNGELDVSLLPCFYKKIMKDFSGG
jgi:hypothetical protein